MMQRILCPIDFSECSQSALRYAADLAQHFHGVLTALHVVEVPVFVLEGAIGSDERMEAIRTRMNETLDALCAEVEQRGVRAESRTAEGLAWQEIVEEAKRGGYDLLVIGTHGRTGLKHALLGSVAERVVRHAPCPVLTVRSAD